MTRFFTINSGSSGNSAFIETENGYGILIDAGGSFKRIKDALTQNDVSLSKITAVLITHEHSDHTSALRVLSKNLKIPIIANKATLLKIYNSNLEIDKNLFLELPTGASATTDYFKVKSFHTSHDSVEAVGYRVETNNAVVVTATDTGIVTREMLQSIKGANVVLAEANYDLHTLKNGGYPPYLISRILSETGHLDNSDCGDFVSLLAKTGVENVILGHLSNENNTVSLATNTVISKLTENGVTQKDILLKVAPRYENSHIYTF
ncbi:MAG: MBL fold metallo-hydrolase [Clostridia bacterium]